MGGIVVSIGILFDLVYLTEKGKVPVRAMHQVRHVIADVALPFTVAPVNILVMDHFAKPGSTRLPDP